MNDQQKQLVDRLKQAQNVLVTVSKNPSIDQLSAAIGLTIALNKLDKHATAVYSGQTPSTLDFLKPEETLEDNTDSLRDFIIALDKSKADKLRYKVEDDVVRIFITPYRTSISEQDLDFSQGDFNVDVVVALGVHAQQDLDEAVQAHGRILHDATMACLATEGQVELGTLNWVDTNASSLSEMVTKLVDSLGKKIIDTQIATALLTGIVATTERFSNDKTTPDTMTVSAELMAGGANQQLIATELAAPVEDRQADAPNDDVNGEMPVAPPREPGMLEIDHDEEPEEPAPEPEQPAEPQPQIQVDADGHIQNNDIAASPEPDLPKITGVRASPNDAPNNMDAGMPQRERLDDPSPLDPMMSANTETEAYSPGVAELTLPAVDQPLLSHNESVLMPQPEETTPQPDTNPVDSTPPPSMYQQSAAQPQPAPQPVPQPMAPPPPPAYEPPPQPQPVYEPTPPPAPVKSLAELEAEIQAQHAESAAPTSENPVDSARDAIDAIFQNSSSSTQPDVDLNAQPLGGELHPAPEVNAPAPPPMNMGFSEQSPGSSPADASLDMPLPTSYTMPSTPQPQPSQAAQPPQQPYPTTNPDVPPVPPPFVPPLN